MGNAPCINLEWLSKVEIFSSTLVKEIEKIVSALLLKRDFLNAWIHFNSEDESLVKIKKEGDADFLTYI